MENENIRKLREQIAAQEAKMSRCKHDFGKPFYNPYTTKEGYGYKLVAQGSDTWGDVEGYRDKTVSRWTKVCKECGFEQHTEKQKDIVSGQEPDFGS